MRNKGFTLIELLAVIVILAIIALIVVPIILNIVNDSKEESNKRSIDMYAKGVENAVATYQVENDKGIKGTFELNPENKKELTQGDTTLIVDYDGDVECDTIEIYEDGNVYVTDCKVNDVEVEYTYGTQQVTQVYKPQYYSWSSGTIRGDKPSDAKETASEINTKGNPYYLGFDVENDKVSAAYVCFTRNETEYCLKGGTDEGAYETNKIVLEDAFKDVEGACKFDDGDSSYCIADGLDAHVYSNGYVFASDGSESEDAGFCYVRVDGSFGRYEN